MIRVGGIALLVKVLLVALGLLAVYSGGFSSFQTLWLGTETIPVNQTIRTQFGLGREGGLLVNRVIEHSPAEQSGLKRGDILLTIDNLPIYGTKDVKVALASKAFQDTVQVVYLRDGITFSTKLILDYRSTSASAGAARSLHRYRLTTADFIGLIMLGFVAGTLSGLIGCGGGVLKVSLLIILFGFEIYLAKVVSLVSCAFMSMSSSYRYIKQGQVDVPALRFLIPSSILGVLLGVGLSLSLNRHVLEIVLGIFLVYVALDAAYEVYAEGRDDTQTPKGASGAGDPAKLIYAGLPLGLFSAVLGITGGVIGTPIQRLLSKAPLKACIANTLVTVVFATLLGGALLLTEGLVRDYFSFKTFIMVLVPVMPGSVIGGQLGARLNQGLPVRYVKSIYAVVVLIISYKVLTAV